MQFLISVLIDILKPFAEHAFIQKIMLLHLLSALFTGWAFIFVLLSTFNCEGEAYDDLVLAPKFLAMPLHFRSHLFLHYKNYIYNIGRNLIYDLPLYIKFQNVEKQNLINFDVTRILIYGY